MRYIIDYNNTFALKIENFHDDEMDIINRFVDDEDFLLISKKQPVFEYVGDDELFINDFSDCIRNPQDHNIWIFFTDRAVEYISKNLDCIQDERKRLYVASACAERLNDEEKLMKVQQKQREIEIIRQKEQEELMNRPETILAPKICGDFEDCYSKVRECSCPDSHNYSIDDYFKNGCPVRKAIRQCRAAGKKYKLVRF